MKTYLGLDFTSEFTNISVRYDGIYKDIQIPYFRRSEQTVWLANLQNALRETLPGIPGEQKPDMVVISIPVTWHYHTRKEIRSLLHSAGIDVNRFCFREGVKGLYIESFRQYGENEACCCIGAEKEGQAEISYFLLDNVMEVDKLQTFSLEKFLSDPELQQVYRTTELYGLDEQYHPVEIVYLSDGIFPGDERYTALYAEKECRMLDPYAASRGDCLYGEILTGESSDRLLLGFLNESLCVSVNGKDKIAVLDSNYAQPLIYPIQKRVTFTREQLQKSLELTVYMQNPSTAAETKLVSFPLPPVCTDISVCIQIRYDYTVHISILADSYALYEAVLH